MGTTAEKLTYLNTTKQKIKDAINNIGGNITSETTFRQYVAALESIYQSMPKVSGSGTTLSLSPTLKGLMQIDLKGNTNQVQLSGRNKLNPVIVNDGTNILQQRCSVSVSDDEFTFVASGTDIYFGNVTSSGNNYANNLGILIEVPTNATKVYMMATNSDFNTLFVCFYDSNKVSLGFRQVESENINIISGAKYINVRIGKNNATSGTTYKTKVMVSFEEITTYEPYCGGTPSPNPSYPQDIHNVSGNNTIYVRNKNLKSEGTIYTFYFNATTFTSGNRTLCIPIEANTTYYIKKPILSNRFRVCLSNAVPSTSTSVYEYQDVSSLTETSITNTNYAYLNIFFYQISETYTEQELYDCLNIYTQETTYPINLPSGMELCKIGTYQDYFYKENDKWYLHKEIGYKVLNGTEDWKYSTNNRVFYVDNWLDRVINSNNMYYDYFNVVPINTSYANMVDGNTRIDTGTNGRSIFKFSTYTSSNDFKNWLSTHNVKSYYQLATATNTEITDTTLISQLEAIYNAKSKNGTTNISQTNNDLPFILDVSALLGSGS